MYPNFPDYQNIGQQNGMQPSMPQYPYYNGYYNPWLNQMQQNMYQQQTNQNQQQNVQQQNNQQVVQSEIQGRYINDISEILAKEVTMDGRTIFFPTKDEKLIYAKRWNNNGTIETGVYKLSSEEHLSMENQDNQLMNIINERFDRMETMISSYGQPKQASRKKVDNDEQ